MYENLFRRLRSRCHTEDEDGDDIQRQCNVKKSTFEKACADLAARPELTANLKQFDLLVWDYYGEGISSLEMGT